jgi:hypothetical protein
VERQINLMISILCPSRGRPELAKRLVDTAKDTANNIDNVEFKFYLNDDDPALEKYYKLLDSSLYTVGPHQSTCFSWNQLADNAKGDILFLAGDDIQFLTPGWDSEFEKVFNQYDDKICMVVPWDCNGKGKGAEHKNKTIPVVIGNESIGAPHFAVHRNWVKALGYFAPPFFWHWYVDSYTQKVSRKLGRCILLPYVHVKAKKVFDETAQLVRTINSINRRDDWVWSKVRDRHLQADVDALKDFIDNFKS